jgi:5-methylcytosine-specific restriction endonuclease McrA
MFAAQDGRCFYCSTEMFIRGQVNKAHSKRYHYLMATFDHIIPKSKGGTYRFENGVCACKRCNVLRGNIAFTKFRERWQEFHNIFANRESKKQVSIAKARMNSYVIARYAFHAGLTVKEAFIENGIPEEIWR